MKRLLLVATLLFTGCAGFNSAMTPGIEIINDDFSGATIVRQDPVSSSSSLAESWHILGFEWSTGKPDTIYITAGLVMQTKPIIGVEFKADNQIITKIEQASTHTEFVNKQSLRRFSMPLSEFQKIVDSKDVKMKIIYNFGNDYSVSSFGTNHPDTLTTSKIPRFMEKVEELRALTLK